MMQTPIYSTYRFSGSDVHTSNLVVQSQSQALSWDGAKYNENAEKVKMKRLPFFEVQEVLMKSQCLAPNVVKIVDQNRRRIESRYTFGLTVQQAALIADSINFNKATNKIDYGYEIQLRFALLDPKTEQEDNFPPSVFIRVNNKPVTLPPAIQSNYPGVPPRQPSVPLNITDHVKLRPSSLTGFNGPPNVIQVFWMPDPMERKYCLSLSLVQKLSSNDLLNTMLVRGNFKSEVTRKLINSKMTAEADDDMALTSLKVSVTCPLGKSRMTLPCRASTCSHIQCFDALLYLQMTEKKPVWNCPVCHKDLLYENLAVDGFFVDVLKNLSPTAGNDIEIMPDGSWKSLDDSKSTEDLKQTQVTKAETDSDFVLLDDDDGMDVDQPKESQSKTVPKTSGGKSSTSNPSTVPRPSESQSIEVICLDDDSDDDTNTNTGAVAGASTVTSTTSSNILNTNILAALNAPPVSASGSQQSTAGKPTTTQNRWLPKSSTLSVTTTTTTVSSTSASNSNLNVFAKSNPVANSVTAKVVPLPKTATAYNKSRFQDDDDDVICLSD